MGETTGISWTDSTFNPWIGCTQVSPGCDNCYAMIQDRRWGHDSWGKGTPRRLTSRSYWSAPEKWNREAEKEGRKHLVFCASLADVMDDEAPFNGRSALWSLIDDTPYLIWQLLTKRPHRYERYLPGEFRYNNVWLGATAENQEQYAARLPILLRACEKFNCLSWISYEPALGPLDLGAFPVLPRWLILGGESGAHRRPDDLRWYRDIVSWRNEFQPHLRLFMKQMSARTPAEGKALVPDDLMIQEFPHEIER